MAQTPDGAALRVGTKAELQEQSVMVVRGLESPWFWPSPPRDEKLR